ncbi:hypothetical protein [Burkholderia sp. Bp9004]|uniref:hypothetical protein n=1 Tax=Burkholderia sp. Bp9004 TaxID=2184559 RepID=UPI000F5FDF07|nr:hypothetical protein [Burkholderia sp. Bp9004]
MYFSGLRRAIQDVEEKKFYDVALLFLQSEGYRDLSIIDGTGDGGRDVSCSRTDLRIQLSVRKDWENKINSEADATRNAGKRHLIYITNRLIRDTDLAKFKNSKYKQKGEVELSVFDLNRISTSLSAPGTIKSAYERLGYLVQGKITATPKEIALSNLLLFSSEAKDLRQDVIESNIRAYIFKHPSSSNDDVVSAIGSSLPGIDIEHDARSALSRLIVRGEIVSNAGIVDLSIKTKNLMEAAEEDYTQSINKDVSSILEKYSLSVDDARRLIEMALEISAREGVLNGDGIQETALAEFISNHNLIRRKDELYEDLSKLSVARVSQYGKTLDHIFSTNTFDIYRALGRTTDVRMLLDSSVAMPLMFGLCFGSVRSRYSIAAAALHQLCQSHNISIAVPRCYVNEIVFHGKEALEFAQTYTALNEANKSALKASSNSYLSHYSHLRERGELKENYSLKDFLAHFGLSGNAPARQVENTIESILEDFGIEIISAGRWDADIRQEIADGKPGSPPIIIDHDASVCTFLKNSVDEGFIFSTWDKVMMSVVEGKSRIFASSPSRVADFLSMAGGSEMESTQSFNLLGSLLYCDERKAAALAARIERIESAEKAYEFQNLAAAARRVAYDDDGSHNDAANDDAYKD